MNVATRAADGEREKYHRMWRDHPDYRVNSPGEMVVLKWLNLTKPRPGASVIDFGCGTGRASMVMGLMGFDVTMVDFVDNCLDPDVRDLVGLRQLRFVQQDLTDPDLPRRLPKASYGYCCDVMEHLPPELVEQTIASIMGCIFREAWFLVALRDDVYGEHIGETLHLTVRPFTWWRDLFRQHGQLIEARDLIMNGLYRVTK